MASSNKVDTHKPPPRPWRRGIHPDHKVLHLLVRVVENSYGWTFSESVFEDPGDEEIAARMSSGGHRQIAFALLTEACRREVFLQVLMQMSAPGGRHLLVLYAKGGEDREKVIEQVTNHAITVMARTIKKMMRPAVEGVFEMMLGQMTAKGDSS